MHLWELLLYCTSHYCKNYQFYSFQKMLRKSQTASYYCKNYQFHTFKPSGQKLPHITAKITDFRFSTHCPENHYCKNYQFHISRPMPRKNFQFYISRPVPRKSSNLSQLTVCLTVSGEKMRKEEKNPNIEKQSRTANNSKNIGFLIKMWSLVFQLDLEMSYHKFIA